MVNFFKGSFHDLQTAREESNIPLLCKDFIIDKIQIDRAYEAGADIIFTNCSSVNEREVKRVV